MNDDDLADDFSVDVLLKQLRAVEAERDALRAEVERLKAARLPKFEPLERIDPNAEWSEHSGGQT